MTSTYPIDYISASTLVWMFGIIAAAIGGLVIGFFRHVSHCTEYHRKTAHDLGRIKQALGIQD